MRMRSYHRAFAVDRRIYRVDRWTVPVPGGLPLAASVWFLVLALAMWGACQLPGLRLIVAAVGWPAAVIVAPGASAILLTKRCEDGRTVPRLRIDQLRHSSRPHMCTGLRRASKMQLQRYVFVASDATLPGAARVLGPGRILVPASSTIERVHGEVRVVAGSALERAQDVVVLLGDDERIGAYA